MQQVNLGLKEMVLAYELRQEGLSWRRIARGLELECDWRILKDRIRNLEKGGLHDPRIVVSDASLRIAKQMREHSRLSWGAIARYLGTESGSLRAAYSRRVTHG